MNYHSPTTNVIVFHTCKHQPQRRLYINNIFRHLSFNIDQYLTAKYSNTGMSQLPLAHSSGAFWCLLSCVDWEKLRKHLLHLKGFSPVWVLIWLFRVVAPAKDRPQNPHLNGFSFTWMTTCSRRSLGPSNEAGQWPHWYGFSGAWEQTCICSRTRCVKVWEHCPHFHTCGSSLSRKSNLNISCPADGSSRPSRSCHKNVTREVLDRKSNTHTIFFTTQSKCKSIHIYWRGRKCRRRERNRRRWPDVDVDADTDKGVSCDIDTGIWLETCT